MSQNNSTINILIYGASVSAQDKNDSYWLGLKNWEAKWNANSLNKISISMLCFPSAFISGAGFFNLSHVIAMSPDVVILDWLSTAEQDCPTEVLKAIYEELWVRDITVITTAMIRLDTWDYLSPQYIACYSLAKKKRQPFIDMAVNAKKLGFNWDDVTRDGVHTNNLGAELYSDCIKAVLTSCINNTEFINSYNPNVKPIDIDKIRSASTKDIVTLNINSEMILDEASVLRLVIIPMSDEVSVWAKQTVGPYTWAIDIYECTVKAEVFVQRIELRDEWCHFERFAFKPLVKNLNTNSRENNIELKLRLPDDNIYFKENSVRPKLRLHDQLFFQGCYVIACEVMNG